ncbi:MAG: cysteine desulfurase [Frankia sp.]|nr:cysteine desulfurase [Frankia sp.]
MIYLDYNATTPVHPQVLDAMLPVFTQQFANAASKHAAGQAAAKLVENARHEVASLVGTRRRNVVFTSGATEAAHLAIRGVLAAAEPERRRVLVGATEHRAVLAAADAAADAHSGKVDLIRVNRDGTVDLDHLDWLLDGDVALVAVAVANNETGVINDVAEMVPLVHDAGALFCCDITQGAGRIAIALDDWQVDLAVWSAHKLYGPKGVGALAASRLLQARLAPLLTGGGQERGLRAGTLNTAGIVGFGAASRLAAADRDDEAIRERDLTRLLHRLITARVDAQLNGQGALRLPNTVNLRFAGAPADAVQTRMPEVLVSAGSACSSTDPEPSHVLLAMGLTEDEALESLRFSLGRPTTEAEIRIAADHIADAVEAVRELHGESHSRKAV